MVLPIVLAVLTSRLSDEPTVLPPGHRYGVTVQDLRTADIVTPVKTKGQWRLDSKERPKECAITVEPLDPKLGSLNVRFPLGLGRAPAIFLDLSPQRTYLLIARRPRQGVLSFRLNWYPHQDLVRPLKVEAANDVGGLALIPVVSPIESASDKALGAFKALVSSLPKLSHQEVRLVANFLYHSAWMSISSADPSVDPTGAASIEKFWRDDIGTQLTDLQLKDPVERAWAAALRVRWKTKDSRLRFISLLDEAWEKGLGESPLDQNLIGLLDFYGWPGDGDDPRPGLKINRALTDLTFRTQSDTLRAYVIQYLHLNLPLERSAIGVFLDSPSPEVRLAVLRRLAQASGSPDLDVSDVGFTAEREAELIQIWKKRLNLGKQAKP